jgi:signal peptidase I
MKCKSAQDINRPLPTTQELEAQLQHEQYRSRYRKVLRSTIYMLIVASAIAILVVTLWMPVLRVYGTSMTPTLTDGEIVILNKGAKANTGDVIAFYYNNKILIKRVIATAGDWVDIDENGTVSVNGQQLEEPYVTQKALGVCDIEFPYQVPDERVFVLGDHRSVSVDSRSTQIGCVAQEQIVGKLVFRVWPFQRLGGFFT